VDDATPSAELTPMIPVLIEDAQQQKQYNTTIMPVMAIGDPFFIVYIYTYYFLNG
jgi:hypothetical protein